MIIKNDVCILKGLMEKQKNNPEVEHCAFGYGIITECCRNTLTIVDYTEVDKYICPMADGIIIPKRVCVAFLASCRNNNGIPIIYHTHGAIYKNGQYLQVDFSKQDMQFVVSFVEYAKDKKEIKECVFAVTDGITVKYYIVNGTNIEEYFKSLTE